MYTYSEPTHAYLHTHRYTHVHAHTHMHKRRGDEFQEVGVTGHHLRSCLAQGPTHKYAPLDPCLEFLGRKPLLHCPLSLWGTELSLGLEQQLGGFISRMEHPMASKLVLVEWALSHGHGPGILSPSLSVPWASSQQGGCVLRARM